MKLSTKGRYRARAMLDIALNYEKGPVSLKDLARRQEVSVKYMEQLIPLLKMAGLIRSVRGAGGGYTLSKDPHQIKPRNIIDVLEGSMRGQPRPGELWEHSSATLRNQIPYFLSANQCLSRKSNGGGSIGGAWKLVRRRYTEVGTPDNRIMWFLTKS